MSLSDLAILLLSPCSYLPACPSRANGKRVARLLPSPPDVALPFSKQLSLQVFVEAILSAKQATTVKRDLQKASKSANWDASSGPRAS